LAQFNSHYNTKIFIKARLSVAITISNLHQCIKVVINQACGNVWKISTVVGAVHKQTHRMWVDKLQGA
jgi:hypothetical protein